MHCCFLLQHNPLVLDNGKVTGMLNFYELTNRVELLSPLMTLKLLLKVKLLHFVSLFIENLQYLRLGDNDLHMIPSDALRPLHRLRHLDMRSNNISIIPEDAFFGFGDSITFLNLQKNE